MRKCFFVILVIFSFLPVSLSAQAVYLREQMNIIGMLKGNSPLNLQQAVFSVENAYFGGILNREVFNNYIASCTDLCRGIIQNGDIRYEGMRDEESAKAQCAVFVFMTDSVPVQIGNDIAWHEPFAYNFDDYAGNQDWSSMFVSTLMETGKGNCHSMPLLYKMIMDSLGEKSWLALAPNHMYIKAWNQRAGWYNIELTCGDFPTDAWLTTHGYIHLDAIRNGCYMDTLSLKQSVALCLVDLAQGYIRKYGIGDGRFVMECCDIALEHFPNYLNAWHIKADVITGAYMEIEDKSSAAALELEEKMNEIYTHIHELGYRKMPPEMYMSWLYSLNEYSNEYRTKKITIYKNNK